MTDIINDTIGAVSGSGAAITAFIKGSGYLALILLMTLEGAALPVPSELVIPAAGYFASQGSLNIYLVFIAILIGNTIGLAIDYAIGYYIGKDVIYKHLKFFRVSEESLNTFDEWFNRNGTIAVFISRMFPEIRALISFPAGFAKMPLKKFFFWSILGCAIWDVILLLFGYYLISNAFVVATAVGVFALVVYIAYRLTLGRVKRAQKG